MHKMYSIKLTGTADSSKTKDSEAIMNKNSIKSDRAQIAAIIGGILLLFAAFFIAFSVQDQKQGENREGLIQETARLDTSGLILEVGEDERSVRVNWYSNEKSDFELQYGIPSGDGEADNYVSVPLSRRKGGVGGAFCYTAGMTALEADSRYVYRILETGSGKMSRDYIYRTAQVEEMFTFLFAGDPQIGAEGTKEDSKKWDETLKKSVSLVPEASFIITAGDQTDSSDKKKANKQYLGFRSPDVLKELPAAVNRGNHEAGNDLYEKQFQREGQQGMEYSLLYKNVLFIALDSMSTEPVQQIEFFRNTVETYPADWIVVTMHYSLFSAGSHAYDHDIIRQREYFAPVFSECNVDLVLAGHDHSYMRTYYMNGLNSTGKDGGKKERGEVLYLTGGSSTGNKFYKKTKKEVGYDAFFLEDKIPVVTSVNVNGKTMTIRTFDVDSNEEIDFCEIRK